MKFYPIFTEEENCGLWTVHYPEDVDTVFNILFDNWSNAEYVRVNLNDKRDDLLSPFWKGLSFSKAVQQIRYESSTFERLLFSIDQKLPGYEHLTFRDIFKKLHKNIFSLNFKNESHRKARPTNENSILRLYGIELEDETLVVTGGLIKLTEKMMGDEFDKEFNNLDRVQRFLKANGIVDKQGLIEF